MKMVMKALCVGMVLTILCCGFGTLGLAGEVNLHKGIADYIAQRESEFDQIPAERKQQLQQLADHLDACAAAGIPARFTFICTHNSRRSHMSQLWAAVAAARYGIEGVETYSGGTEATAFNPRAVAAMERAGFKIEVAEKGSNPKYEVSFAANANPQVCFSKVYSDASNPNKDFCAVMTCSSADQSCPSVNGAASRVAIPYEDPKVADNTPEEGGKYDERSAQIARELLYAFSLAKKSK